MSRQTAARDLKQLAEAYGIQTAYRDVHGQRQPATPEGLLAALPALGVTIDEVRHATDALRQCRQTDWQRLVDPVATEGLATIEGTAYACKCLPLPANMPCGYHQLRIDTDGRQADVRVICAPPKAFLPRAGDRMRSLFAPVYALHSAHSWGSGDFSDLAQLMTWTAGRGGGVVDFLRQQSASRA